MLEMKGIDKSFDGKVVLSSVSLGLAAGEFFSILGPSGCGKSTLLRILAGFDHPDRGEVYLSGASVTKTPPHARPVNMVFQRYALFPHMDVAENVAFSLRIRKVARAERLRLVDEALALVAMDGFGRRRIDTLSGGEQQRVALARALINRPKVLLLDEPLSALDLKIRVRMQAELRSLQRRLGMTFVFVTHDQSEALTMSDRIAVMNRGRVEQVGTPQDVYERPDTAFVASFLGAMNRLRGQFVGPVAGKSTHGWVDLGAGTRFMARLPRLQQNLPIGREVQVQVRPEKVQLARVRQQEPASSAQDVHLNEFSCTLSDIFYRGATVDMSGVFQAQSSVVTATLLNADRGATSLGVGDSVRFGFAADDAWILNSEESHEA